MFTHPEIGTLVRIYTHLVRDRLPSVMFKQVSLNPSNLRLLGKSPTLWELRLTGLNTFNFESVGEGDINRNSPNSYLSNSRNRFLQNRLNINLLPN